jgi:hypothetical protein
MTGQGRAEPGRHRRPSVQDHAELDAPDAAALDRDPQVIVHPTVEHVHGPEEVSYGVDELIVLCLVRDGRPFVRSFVEHYFSMGVKHLIFLDNGSTDGTVEALKNYDNVTVLRSELPPGLHLMKRYLTERFGRERWSLCVDIDELFDYPYSDVVGLNSLLGYLNSNSYTAVVAQMLDMFPEKPLTGQAGNLDEPLKEVHRFYDTSNLRRKRIIDHPRCPPDNAYGSDDIAAFIGGIRLAIFGSNVSLTKYPLVFLNDEVKLGPGSHWHSNVRAADFTGVLLHYKFLDEHLHKQAVQAAEQRTSKSSAWYGKYLELVGETSSLSIKTDTSKELKSVNDHVGTQLVSISRQYMRFVKNEEQRDGPYSEQRRSERLFDAFFNARAEVTALAEQVGAMRQQNRILRQKYRRTSNKEQEQQD